MTNQDQGLTLHRSFVMGQQDLLTHIFKFLPLIPHVCRLSSVSKLYDPPFLLPASSSYSCSTTKPFRFNELCESGEFWSDLSLGDKYSTMHTGEHWTVSQRLLMNILKTKAPFVKSLRLVRHPFNYPTLLLHPPPSVLHRFFTAPFVFSHMLIFFKDISGALSHDVFEKIRSGGIPNLESLTIIQSSSSDRHHYLSLKIAGKVCPSSLSFTPFFPSSAKSRENYFL